MRKILLALLIALGGALAFPSASQAATEQPCEAYVFINGGANLCEKFAGREDVNCPEIGAPVKLVGDSDPWNLSQGGAESIGCEDGSSPSPSVSASAKPSPSKSRESVAPTRSTSRTPQRSEALPLTGPGGGAIAGIGASVLLVGAGLAYAARRRRTRFVS